MPTPRFWWLAAAGVPLAAVAAQLGSPFLAVAYDVGLAAVAFATARLGPDPRKLRITRRRDPVLSVRRANRILVSVENEGDVPIVGRIRDEPPPHWPSTEKEFDISLRPAGLAEKDYHVTPPERGTDAFRATFVRVRCPLGLVERQERLDTREEARVYPDVLALKEFGLLQPDGAPARDGHPPHAPAGRGDGVREPEALHRGRRVPRHRLEGHRPASASPSSAATRRSGTRR